MIGLKVVLDFRKHQQKVLEKKRAAERAAKIRKVWVWMPLVIASLYLIIMMILVGKPS